MAGTREGGLLTAEKNKREYGADFYARIGSLGGKKSKTGGFYADRDRAKKVGQIGGKLSKRGHKLIKRGRFFNTYINLSTLERVKFRNHA